MPADPSTSVAPRLGGRNARRSPRPSRGRILFWVLAALAPLTAWAAHATLGLGVRPEAGFAALWPLLGAPVIEEWLFRQGLQQGLLGRGCSPGVASLATAMVFAACHFPQAGVLCIAWVVPGLALAVLWESGGRRVGPCIAMHAWFNACLGFFS